MHVAVFAYLHPQVPGLRVAAHSAQTTAVGGAGSHKVGMGTACVNFSWQEMGRKEEKKEWLASLSGEAGLRGLTDKDATDRLAADDHIKQAQESKWRRALSPVTKPNWISVIISKWYPRGAAAGLLFSSGAEREHLCLHWWKHHLLKLSWAN